MRYAHYMLRALGVLAVLTATAAADTSVELRIENRRIEASVVGIERQMQLELRDGDRRVAPLIVRDFKQGKPLALLLVIAGNEMSMGTDDFADSEPRGLLKPLADVIDGIDLASMLPPDSNVCVVAYGHRVEIKVPWKPIEQLAGSDLGTQRDYVNHTDSNLVAGMTIAIDELARRPEQRKLMIVIGDGSDATGDKADAAMRDLREHAKGLDIVALVVKHASSPEEISIDELTDRARETPIDRLSLELLDALGVATRRFEAVFDLGAFAQDGQEHTFRLMTGETELGSARLKMPGTPPPSKTWRWLVVGGVIVAFALMSLVLFRPRGRQV